LGKLRRSGAGGEDSLTAIRRELWEETGIRASETEIEFLRSVRDRNCFYDHYCLKWNGSVEDVVLLPGETDGVKWVDFNEIHRMIAAGEICRIIAGQFLEEEPRLLKRQSAQELV
jgi:8-oxo-dGTP pyrophosphatase MutT (NUDIX family)